MYQKAVMTTRILILLRCASTQESKLDYSNLTLSDGELLKEKWKSLSRFSARYPLSAAKSSKVGCATVEYVITPDNKIANVVVTEASDLVFAKNSKKVVSNWNWSQLPKNTISEALKTQTRFNFCLESEGVSCAEVIKSFSCSGTDSISSIGTKIKRGS